jgi:hypothetical protein
MHLIIICGILIVHVYVDIYYCIILLIMRCSIPWNETCDQYDEAGSIYTFFADHLASLWMDFVNSCCYAEHTY